MAFTFSDVSGIRKDNTGLCAMSEEAWLRVIMKTRYY